jgi:hypothetical protein
MTAAQIDGIQVVSDEPTPAPISRPDRPVLWQQIRTLRLADGREVYGCVHCDMTADSPHRVRPHLKAHKEKPAATPPKSPAGELTLNQLSVKLKEFEQLSQERDDWKRRAMAAEKSLRTLRKALGVGS